MQSTLKLLAAAGKSKRATGKMKRSTHASFSSSAMGSAAGATASYAASPSSHASVRAKKDMAGKLSFDASKAGLQKVDKAYVQKVIEESSKGTPFYLKEQRREEERRKRTEMMLEKAEAFANLSDAELRKVQQRVDTMEAEMEAGRDLRRRYIHVDMDMFYAAVEEKKNPRLKDLPFGVGSNAMLSTTNYIARQYGVRSGMPGFIGKKLCPELLIVPVDIRSYRREAAAIHSIASRYDVEFVSVGLDELTMDVTKYLEEFPEKTAVEIAEEFRAEIFLKTRLTASAGIAPTTTLAKIASNVNKPNGQHEVILQTRQEVLDYVKDVPLRKIPGIGYAQEALLNALGIKTCGDLLTHKYLLGYLFKEKSLRHYLATGLGVIETHAHRTTDLRQSVGKESSFSEPLPSRDALKRLFRRLLEFCHMRCVREHLNAEHMQLVLKTRGYDVSNFSVSLPKPTNDLKIWLEASEKLLAPHLDKYDEYRLVGIRMRKLTPVPVLPGSARAATSGGAAGAAGLAAAARLGTPLDAVDDAEDEDADEELDTPYSRDHQRYRNTGRTSYGDDDDDDNGLPRVDKKGHKKSTTTARRSHVMMDASEDPYEGYQDDEGASLKLMHRDGTRAASLPKRVVSKPVEPTRVIEEDEDEEMSVVDRKKYNRQSRDDHDARWCARGSDKRRADTFASSRLDARKPGAAKSEKLKGEQLAAYKAMYEADDDEMDIDLDDDDSDLNKRRSRNDEDDDDADEADGEDMDMAPTPANAKKPPAYGQRKAAPQSIPLSKPARYPASKAPARDDDEDFNDEEEEVFVDAPPKVVKVTPTPAARRTVKKAAAEHSRKPSRR